jgi:hypothetical protein
MGSKPKVVPVVEVETQLVLHLKVVAAAQDMTMIRT